MPPAGGRMGARGGSGSYAASYEAGGRQEAPPSTPQGDAGADARSWGGGSDLGPGWVGVLDKPERGGREAANLYATGGRRDVKKKSRDLPQSPSLKDSYVWREVVALKEQLRGVEQQNELLQECLVQAEARAAEAELERDSLGEHLQPDSPEKSSYKDLEHTMEEQSLRMEEMQAGLAIAQAECQAWEACAQAAATRVESVSLCRQEATEVLIRRGILAYYWARAADHQICPEIATQRAAYWRSRSEASRSVVDIMSEVCLRESSDGNGGGMIGGYGTSLTPADMVEAERGMRELCELRIQRYVRDSMKECYRPRLAKVMKAPQMLSKCSMFLALSEDQVEELKIRTLWTLYIWDQAFKEKIDLNISTGKRDFWLERALEPPCTKRHAELQAAQIELQVFGVESKLWNARRL